MSGWRQLSETMQKLTGYKRNGFLFTVTDRVGDIAMAHGQSARGGETWEVIRIRRHNGRVIGGVHVPPAEFAPANNEWGRHGWTYRSREAARSAFNVKAREQFKQAER